ncbi:MAG: hypothetical protein WC841_03970 [Candidatus Shapirobacteria bacterium]|jgi:hypothetical protein
MKLKDLVGDYLLITILAVIALLMLLTRIIYTAGNKRQNDSRELLKTTVPSLAPTPTSSNIDFEKSYPLWKLLPYTGDGFVVEKYTEPLVLKVSLEKGEKSAGIEKVEKWLEENEISPETHVIVWE